MATEGALQPTEYARIRDTFNRYHPGEHAFGISPVPATPDTDEPGEHVVATVYAKDSTVVDWFGRLLTRIPYVGGHLAFLLRRLQSPDTEYTVTADDRDLESAELRFH